MFEDVETFDTFVCELDDQRRHANRSAKNGQRVPHRKRQTSRRVFMIRDLNCTLL